MPQLLMMPDLPPEASEWKAQYCQRWLRLLQAQEELLSTQLRVVETQRELVRELLDRKE